MTAPDLLEVGIYTVTEAAYLVGVSEQKVRGWITGYPRRDAAPVIQNDIGWSNERLAFSFNNLMEMRFIAYFEENGVRFNVIRSVMDEVKALTEHPHPFSTNIVFQTDGKKIIASVLGKHAKKTTIDLKTRNLEMSTVIYDSLKKDVEFDYHGAARSWFPRRKLAPNVIVHPKFSFGRPILRGPRIPTRTIYDAVATERSSETVADLYDLPVRQVREAVKFEYALRKAA